MAKPKKKKKELFLLFELHMAWSLRVLCSL